MYRTGKKRAFSIAEALITLMIISLILAAVIPVMSKRQMTSDSMWRYAANNSDIFYGLGDSQAAIIGAESVPNSSIGSRLVIVTTPGVGDVSTASKPDDTIRRSILDFQQRTTNGVVPIGKISFDQRLNIAIGRDALRDTQTGIGNIAIGRRALILNSSGGSNTAVGNSALALSTGNGNTAIGSSSMSSGMGAPGVVGNENTAIGNFSLTAFRSANNNTAVGSHSLTSNRTGNDNTATGAYALRTNGSITPAAALTFDPYDVTESSRNVANGYMALSSNTTGSKNTANGTGALLFNTTASFNTAIGYLALYDNNQAVAVQNTAVGSLALFSNYAGTQNTAIGSDALTNSGSGSKNTAVGYSSCSDVKTGSSNVCLGYFAGPSRDYGGNKLYIDVSKRDDPLIGGNFTDREVNISGSLFAQGGSLNGSDKRLKNVYGFNKAGIEKLNQLQIKNYVYKRDKRKTPRVGVIAQELQKVFPNSVTKGEDGYLYIDNNEMFYAMINSVRDLYKQVQSLIARVSGLDKRIAKLEKRVAEQDRRIAQIEKTLKKK